MNIRALFLISVCQLAVVSAYGQANNIYHRNPDKIKVFGPNGEQGMAWCGGVNNPQFAVADLNRDGKKDLIIFERPGNLRTFINIGAPGETKFKYAPRYENNFPSAAYYFKLIDYNKDNIPDMWHYGSSGAEVCKGYYSSANELAFRDCKEIRYGTHINIGINPFDMPAMADVDKDGDIDIITYSQWGNLIDWYRNLQADQGLTDYKFERADKCWGKIIQIEDTRPRQLGYSCGAPKPADTSGGHNKTTGGNHGLCLFDADGDGDFDVLDGAYNLPDVQYLKNGRMEYGNKQDTMIYQDTMWQTGGRKVDINTFPIAYWVDIDNDGDNDLLFSPLMGNTENYKCISYYKNIASDASPDFRFQTDTLFMNNIIDLGSNTFPVIYDYNKDGKLDMLVGSAGYYEKVNGTLRSRMSYYENTGTGSQASFTLKTTDFLNIGANAFVGAAPAIGDLDGDGKDDMVLGLSDGKLKFYRNYAPSATDQPQWNLIQGNLVSGSNDIDVGDNATPLIYDFDKDGNNDLIVGNKRGKLVYYRNLGNAQGGKPSLQFVTDFLGSVSVVTGVNIYGSSAPFIGKIDNTGAEYLLVGNDAGNIARYSFQHGNTTSPFTRIDSIYADIRVRESFAAPNVADIDGDGKYEMILGNGLGGLQLYEQIFNVGVDDIASSKAGTLKLYPNPAQDELTISTADGGLLNMGTVRILNHIGQVVNTAATSAGQAHLRIDIGNLPAGIYLCSFSANGQTHTASFIKK